MGLRLVAGLVLALALLAAAAGRSQANETVVTFVFASDIYKMSEQAGPDGRPRGGFARLNGAIKAEKAAGAAAGRLVIAVNGGDVISPSLMSGFDQGAHIIDLMNSSPLDVFVPGNHEYDFGRDVFFKRMEEARFPKLAANLRRRDGSPVPGFQDRVLMEAGGVKIALVGLTADDSPTKSNPQDLVIAASESTLIAQAAAARREGADLVVAVVHAPRAQDTALMALRVADIVLSGDDHHLEARYDGRTAFAEGIEEAVVVIALDVTLRVREVEGRRSVSWFPAFRFIDTATVTPDPETLAKVAGYEAELSKELDVVIGTTAVELDTRNAVVRTQEAAFGNLVADAIRLKTGADVAIVNGGGFRAGKVYAKGTPITRRDILSEMPFGNRTVTFEMSGAQLKTVLEHGLAAWPQPAGRFPQVSGLTVEAEGGRTPGERVTAITVGGKPLDPAARYVVATNDFLGRGGDGYTMFREARPLLRDYDGTLIANDAMVHIRRLGTVMTGPEGRVRMR
jgi:2',3'-cyclic-nucleotide 2'-phosphodiesterase (5'-nucleotidase family)